MLFYGANMKILAFLTLFLTFTSLFAQNTPATKDDIKMILEQMREDNRILREDMNKRFEQVDKRFEMMQHNMDKQFEMMQHNMDKQFEMMQRQIDSRFNTVYWVFGFLITAIGSLFIQNVLMIKRIGRLEPSLVQNNRVQESPVTPEPLSQVQRTPERQIIDRSAFIAFLRESDAQTKQEIKQILEI